MRFGILQDATEAIGGTPLIRLDRFAEKHGLKCNILAKVEFFSAGGSIKDRIAKRMIAQAEFHNLIDPSRTTLIEPTSGNTGIGLSLVGLLRGYKVIIVMPDKMSLEKEAVLRALGAEVVRTKTEEKWDSPESHIGVARRLAASISGGIVLDQYTNPSNPLAHYHETFAEIQHSLDTADGISNRSIDVLICGAGTGGTVTGMSRAMKDRYDGTYPGGARQGLSNGHNGKHEGEGEHGPNGKEEPNGQVDFRLERRPLGKVVAVDPVGSILGGGEVGPYQVEGIGYDFFPDVLDPSDKCVSAWIKTDDAESFAATHEIMYEIDPRPKTAVHGLRCDLPNDLSRTEGLLVGGSSGSAIAGMLKYLKMNMHGTKIAGDAEANVVVVLPDGIRNYIGKDWFLKGAMEGAGNNGLKSQIEKVLGKTR